MEISALLLAKTQFALSLNFHVLFAAIAMALGWLLSVFRFLSWRAPDSAWMAAYRFWVRIFALVFFLALASAVPVLLELGILWPPLMERIGNVAGPLIAFGITTLFVIKSVFLGVMFFGQRRVSSGAHLFAVCMVAIGLTVTIFWELVLQSWTHTPTGATLVDGLYQIDDWFHVILNPSLRWYALLFGAGGFLVVGCLLIAVAAWQASRRPLEDSERKTYSMGIVVIVMAAIMQLVALDGTMRLLAREQPVTAAAVMGFWQTGPQADLIWIGWPSADDQQSAGLIVTQAAAGRWLSRQDDQQWVGLDQASEGERPAVKTLFWLFRLAGYGTMFVLGLMVVTLWIRLRRGTDPGKCPPWLLRAQVWTGLVGTGVWVCTWNLGELGRSPYMVWMTLKQEDLLTTAGGSTLMAGLAASSLLYAILLGGFIKMFFHAARYGVVPVRKPGVRI